jgi:hypothetical protein
MDTLIPIDSPAWTFRLFDLAGVARNLDRTPKQVVILTFWSAECPWSDRRSGSGRPATRSDANGPLWLYDCPLRVIRRSVRRGRAALEVKGWRK